MVTSQFTKLFYCERANIAHIQSGDTLDVFNSLLLRKELRGLDVMGEEEEGISASLNRPEVMLDCKCMLPDILLDMLDWATDGVRV